MRFTVSCYFSLVFFSALFVLTTHSREEENHDAIATDHTASAPRYFLHDHTTPLLPPTKASVQQYGAVWSHLSHDNSPPIGLSDHPVEQAWLGDFPSYDHHSMISYTALSLALQMHAAPPELIQATLEAAMDQVRHTRESYQVASLLAAHVLEPDIPIFSLSFPTQNLTALAISVAKGGCIQETRRVLELARFLQETPVDEDDSKQLNWILTKTRERMEDKVDHAVLAWRILNWICTVDQTACTITRQHTMTHKYLLSFRLGSQAAEVGDMYNTTVEEDMDWAWRVIVEHLLPIMEGGTLDKAGTPFQYDVEKHPSPIVAVARDIVNGLRANTAAPSQCGS